MDSYKAMDWIHADDRKHEPWRAGFTPSELMDRNASGSSLMGQLADLYNSSTESGWTVSKRDGYFLHPELKQQPVARNWNTVVIQLVADPMEAIHAPLMTTADKLDLIKAAFDISLSNFAKILRISRPSLYSWLEGEEPREASVQRIEQISEYARRWNELNQFHFSPAPLFRQKLGDTPSMLERLMREELDQGEIEEGLKAVLELMQRRRDRMDRSKQRTDNSTTSERELTRNRHSLTGSTGSSD